MKKIKKIIVFGVIAFLVVLIVAGIAVGFFLGDIVKAGMQTVGPKVTQVSITVDKVGVSILTGSVSIKGLVVGNPEGYTAPQAISLGEATVSISPMSVLSDKIVVHEVHVLSPEITFEGNPLTGRNNLSKIMDNVSAFQGGGGASAAANTNAPASSKPAKKLEVDDFLLTGAKVHYGDVTLPLPDIHLTDLGTDENGITAADLTKRVLSEITSATLKAVAESATNLGGTAGKAMGNGLDSVKKGIGNLFGK
jgi:uncharacterized protein involved in outer membrane biogenesis